MIDKINKSCFWFYDKALPEAEQKMKAVCIDCQKKHQIQGWYWDGENIGYGNYNLNCEFCQTILSNNKEFNV